MKGQMLVVLSIGKKILQKKNPAPQPTTFKCSPQNITQNVVVLKYIRRLW